MSSKEELVRRVKDIYRMLPEEIIEELNIFYWYPLRDLIEKDPVAALLLILAVVGVRYIEPLKMLDDAVETLKRSIKENYDVKIMIFNKKSQNELLYRIVSSNGFKTLYNMYTDIIINNGIVIRELIYKVKDPFLRNFLENIFSSTRPKRLGEERS